MSRDSQLGKELLTLNLAADGVVVVNGTVEKRIENNSTFVR